MASFSQDTIWRDKLGRFGAWREFLGSRNDIFSCRDTLARKNVDFFLANNSRRGIIITYSGIGKFWWEIVHFGANLYIWRDETGPGEKNFWSFSHRDLACIATNIAKPTRQSQECFLIVFFFASQAKQDDFEVTSLLMITMCYATPWIKLLEFFFLCFLY